MNIKKVSKYLMILVCVAVVTLLIAGYSSSKSDFREAGKHCGKYATEQAQSISPGAMVTMYEPLYVSCMRSNGYLLEAREIEQN